MTGVDKRMAPKSKVLDSAAQPGISLFYGSHQTHNVVITREVAEPRLNLVELESVNTELPERNDDGVCGRLVDIDLCAKVVEANIVRRKGLCKTTHDLGPLTHEVIGGRLEKAVIV